MKVLWYAIAGYAGYQLYKHYVSGTPSFAKAVNVQAPQGAK